MTDELHALREIERRLRWESPELVRLFNSHGAAARDESPSAGEDQSAAGRGRDHGIGLLGPRMLNEAEVRTQQRAPLPRTAVASTPTIRPPGRSLSSGPVAVTAPIEAVEIAVAPSTGCATPLCRAA